MSAAQHLRDEANPYWNTEGDSPRSPESGSWDELIVQHRDRVETELELAPEVAKLKGLSGDWEEMGSSVTKTTIMLP